MRTPELGSVTLIHLSFLAETHQEDHQQTPDTSRGNYLNCLEFDLIPSPMSCFIPLINWFVNRKWKPITLFSEKFRGDALTLYFPLVDLRYMTRYPPSGRSSVDRESVISKLSEDDFLTDVSRNRSHSGIKR